MRRHITYANIMASLALFIALGGASYAAVQLPAGSVGRTQLRTHAVTLKKIAPTVRAKLRGAPGPQGLRGADGAPGAQGARGEKGENGEKGDPGTAKAFAFVNPTTCAVGATCGTSKARGVASVFHVDTGVYCAQVPGVDANTSGSMAGVDFQSTHFPEGNASVQADVINRGECAGHGNFTFITQRLPTNGGSAAPSSTVGFWLAVT